MKLTTNEAIHLIEQVNEFVMYGDPLSDETILDAAILAKLVEAYPSETNTVRQKQEEQTRREIAEYHKRQNQEEN